MPGLKYIEKHTSAITKRHIVAAVLGNALEFYDFTIYAFFAGQIGRSFFPTATPLAGLMLSLATFGAGFITRPIGALVLGRYADRAGRRPSMLLSFALIGIAILAMALCPSYAMIGPLSGYTIVIIRLIQGFALGGEVGSSTAFLLEAAPIHRRGIYTALQPISQNLAALTAGIIGFMLAETLNATQLDSFGWRIAMLFGAAILPFGLLLRRSLPETLHIREAVQSGVRRARPQARTVVCSIAILTGGTVATYIQSYLTVYAAEILHMAVHVAFTATITYAGVGIVFNVIGALLSDRFGRKPVMIAPRLLLLATILPAFWLLDRNRDMTTLIAVTAIMTVCASTSGGAIMASIAESMPKHLRSTIVAVIYASAIALFGGTTQLAATWLTSISHSVLAPAWLYIVATFIGLAGMVFIRESAPIKDPEPL